MLLKDNNIKNSNEEIIIKNYAYLFNIFSPLILIFFFIALYIIGKYIVVLSMGGEVNYTFYASIIAVIFFFYHILDGMKGFSKSPPKFIFTENKIFYDFFKDSYKFRQKVETNIDDIKSIKTILNSETPHQFGKLNNKSLMKRFFKDDIGDNFLYFIVYIFGFLSLILNLPIKAIILLKNNEPLSLFYKNLFIEFNDGTAMVINIYREKDYEMISEVLCKHGKKIRKDLILNIYLEEDK